MKSKKKILLTVLTILIIFLCLFTSQVQAADENSSECLYLSDIDYIAGQSRCGWGDFIKDKASSGSKLSVKVEGAYYTFDKGMWAHAASTLVYDISAYKDKYDYFTTYMGLNNTAASSSNGVKFYVYTSENGKDWVNATTATPPVTGPGANARHIQIPLNSTTNYLKLVADANGSNGNDHSVYADAKFVTQEYLDSQSTGMLSVAEYDAQILAYPNKDVSDPGFEMLLLKREFIKNVGDYAFQRFLKDNPDGKEAIDWLMNDLENLHLYVLGGKPDGGSYYNSLTQLTRLYNEYKEDFKDTTPTNNPWYPSLTKGDVYKKMAISLSLTHSTAVGYWAQINHPSNRSDALERYRIYKYLYDNGKFVVSNRQDHTIWFEALQVEEMRYVMNNITDDEELIWLNEYTQKRIDAHPNQEEKYLQPHTYIAYVWPNFQNPIFHDPARKDYWDEKFEGIFSKYGVTYSTPGNMVYKAWMSMRNEFGTGAVCGGISKLGCHIRAAHGTPASVISQPGHAAIIYYRKNAQGKGYWTIDNDVSGWAQSGKTEKLGTRMPLGWGNDSYVSGYAATYIALSQEALNDNENYEKSEKLILLANSYTDSAKKEETLREALSVQRINIDAWWELIKLYKNDSTKTQEDFYNLASELGEALMPFPLPMYNLLNQIKPKLTGSVEYNFKFTLLQTRLLTEGKTFNDSTRALQPAITRTVASYLLGQTDTSLATFSFDGDNAGKIVLSSRFDGNGIRWDYSLDGKQTWKEVSFSGDEEHKLQLTQQEIESITAENDIYVHIVGVNYNEENLYKIDILESQGLPSTIYANDWEDKLLAATPIIKWKLNPNDPWKLWGDEQPDLTGNKNLIVKVAATGVRTEQKGETTFTFTEDTAPDTRKYLPIEHLNVTAYTSQSTDSSRPYYAPNIIDGNRNTLWHTDFSKNVSSTGAFVTIELDEQRYLSAIDFVQKKYRSNDPCFIKNMIVYVSDNGEDWYEVGRKLNCPQNEEFKTIEFSEKISAKYVKLQMATYDMFASLAMINLYEDTTLQKVADFSFDGTNANKLMLIDKYKGQNWQFSIDGGATWKTAQGDEYTFTKEEAQTITAENDIKLRINNIEYLLDIKQTETPTISAYLNDWENKLFGLSNNAKAELEWQIEGTNTWSIYEEEPIVEGNRKLLIRTKAKNVFTASNPVEFQFTEDNNTAKQQYIPIEHLSVQGYTSQSKDANRPYYAPNAIDGNANTIWHSTFDQNLTGQRSFYTIKLDETKFISGIEFMQKKYRDQDPCFIKSAYVYISDNNQDWIELGRLENIPQNEGELRRIDFAESMSGQYVKIEMVTYDMFTSLSLVNLYEDITVKKAGSFSFDGENAKTIILEDAFKVQNWEYSLDGGETWKRATGDSHTLTEEEVEQVNGDNKIKLRINNAEYIINIQKSSTPTITAYLNDLENRLIGMGNTDNLEWKIEKTIAARTSSSWKDYSEEEPIVEGDAKLLIRQKARNIFAPSEPAEFNFTADNQPDTRKYIPISELSLAGFSAEDKAQNGAAANALDGNYNTRWLNSSAGTDTQKYIIVKFDSALYLSAMDYVPHGENGKILGGTIEGSMDGENFTPIATISGWANNQNTKTIDFDEAVKVRYVKITGTDTNYTNAAKKHVGARMFNFYEDTTKKEVVVPTAEIQYSTTEKTNQDVVATLVNPSTEIKVLNNNGSTEYTFTENGTFTFEFEDSEGNKGQTVANVDWIIKTLPTPTLTYDYENPTNKDVTVTVTFDREGTKVTNNGGKNTYTFTENGEFTFEFEGPYGNSGTVTATVDWIIRTLPNATFEYDIKETTNKDVTVTVTFDREGTKILNNGGKNTYTFTKNGEFTFEFEGPYGNQGVATAKVDWIDKTVPMATVKYSTTNKTNQDVVATLETDDNITITNNNGKDTYTFTENGNFTFEFTNELGNKGTATAEVNWIDKKVPTANISYNIIEATNQEVIATVKFDKANVTITNNNGNNTYTFTENKEFTFEFEDEAGNRGTAVAKVTWIDKTLPVATISYSTTNKTNQDVVATVTFNKENVTVKGGNTHTFTANGEYEFEFVGPAGNAGVAIAKVTWIDKKAPEPTLVYSTINKTNQNVTAGVAFDKENVRITNNGEKNSYTFEENGEFTFEYADEAGNKGSVTATVNWIDRKAPTASVSYSTTESTNGKVIATLGEESEEITITNNNGSNTYTFTQNGTFTFEFEDEAGNKGTATATVNWIDKRLPVATISYSTTELTNQDVVATITFDKENVTVDGGNTHTFTKNGEYTFEYTDEAGNDGMATATVNWIDKKVPVATISYNITELTSQDVVASITFDEENVTVEGGNTYTFTENGEYEFKFTDKAGNTGTATAKVTWIDKEKPVATITYSINKPTNKDVIAIISFNKDDVTVKGGNTHTFTENGEYTFEFEDRLGNSGKEVAVVDWIDKVAPKATITYDIEETTDTDVIATIEFDEENVTVAGGETHIFTENGEYTFSFVDEAGNKGTATAKVTWIEKEVTKATITYDIEELTNEDVVATIEFEDKETEVTNNDGQKEYIFTENDEFIFEFIDSKGNEGTAIAKVTWIDKEEPTAEVIYDITETTTQSVTAILTNPSEEIIITNNDGKETYTFTENGSFTFEFMDEAGNEGTATAEVDWIEIKNPSFEINLIAPSEKLNPGDEFEVDVRIDNMQDINKGLIAILGQLEYNKEDVELIEITGENGWNIDQNSFNEDNFKFVTENGKFITENGSLIKLKFKVKETVNESRDTIVKVKSVVASNGDVDITAEDKQVTLHIEKIVVEDAKITSEVYTIKENIISRILPQTKVADFRKQVTSNREISVIDENGNVLGNNDIIKTGMTLKVGEDELRFTMIVIGDINKDGEISLTDLAAIKLHLVEKELLTGDKLMAADIDGNGEVTVTDLAQIRLILVGKLKPEML